MPWSKCSADRSTEPSRRSPLWSANACYRFWLARITHVAKKHKLRIRAFVLYPDHTCLRAARRQVHGICTFDVKVGHEW